MTKDVSFAVDPVIVEKELNLAYVLDQNARKKSYSFAHYEGDSVWKVNLDVWGMVCD